MTTSALAQGKTVLPSTESSTESLDALLEALASGALMLTCPSGKRIVLPSDLVGVLQGMVEALTEGRAVSVSLTPEHLTIEEAAEILDIDSATMTRLLDEAEIRSEGSGRHRRAAVSDVLAFREHLAARQSEAIAEIERISAESGMYELAATPPENDS